jgi:hypothetical protein
MQYGIDDPPRDGEVLSNAGVHVSVRLRNMLLELLDTTSDPASLDENRTHHTDDDVSGDEGAPTLVSATATTILELLRWNVSYACNAVDEDGSNCLNSLLESFQTYVETERNVVESLKKGEIQYRYMEAEMKKQITDEFLDKVEPLSFSHGENMHVYAFMVR